MGHHSDMISIVADGPVLRVTISNPRRRNAIDYPAMADLADVFATAADDPVIRVIVLTGVDGAFCAGADLSAAAGPTPGQVMDCANRLVTAIVETPIPVIARVNGPAAGIGVGLALAADLVYAVEDSYFLLSFTTIGLMPDGGTTALISAAAGRAFAAELALLGRRLPAPEARSAGLINAVVTAAELDATVQAALDKLIHGPRRALELTKQALNATGLHALPGALAREKTGQLELLVSPDFAEGTTAMLQKRKAVFA